MSSKNQDIFQDSPLKDSIRAKIDNSFTAIPDTKPLQGGGQDKAAKGNAKAPGKGAAAARYVIGAIGLILVLGLYMASAMLLSDTLMPAWLPGVIAVPVALATGLPCGQWWHVVTGCWKRWVNMTVHVVVVTAVLAFSFVLANDRGAKGEPVKTEVTVERLYRETRHHTKGVAPPLCAGTRLLRIFRHRTLCRRTDPQLQHIQRAARQAHRRAGGDGRDTRGTVRI